MIDEKILLESIKDEKKFEEIYKKWWGKIYSFILSKIGNSEEAKELSQEVFLKIYLNLENFNPNFKFSTWIFKIAQNLSIDYLRKKQILKSELQEESAVDKRDPLLIMLKDEEKKSIWEKVYKLPEEYKEIIILRHKNELSYEEIAEILNLKLGTVKNRIFKARQLIAKMIEEENEKL